MSNGSAVVRTVPVWMLLLVGAGVTLFHLYSLVTADPEWRIQFVPDDTFYYLVLARNFAEQGLWTFDSGGSLTTGFHLLHAYALAALQSLTQPSGERFVLLGVLLSYIAALPALALAGRFALGSKCLLPCLALLLLLLSRNVSLNLTSGMEWGWVVSLAALYACFYLQLGTERHRRALVMLACFGFLGSLARADFGLFPAALFLAAVPAMRFGWGGLRARGAALGLASSAVGVGFVFLHNHWTTGQMLQSSARMKKLWLETYGASVDPVAQKVLGLFGIAHWATTTLAASLLILASIAVVLSWGRFTKSALGSDAGPEVTADSNRARLWAGSLATVLGYLVVYRLNPASLQHWYTANFVVPLFVVLALPFANLPSRNAIVRAATVLAGLLLAGQIVQASRFLQTPEWPHQASPYRAGQYLKTAELDKAVGSWNAGILGYYQGGQVINLDGLVNNEVYEYAARGALPEYIDQAGIGFLVDYEKMFSLADRRKRGGYDSEEFLQRLTPLRRFDDIPEGWRHLTLYRVEPRVTSGE